MTYVDGFVVPLPSDRVEDYCKISEYAKAVWMDHGALEYREYVGDDLAPAFCTPFPKIAGTKEGETVIFAYIVFKSREHRDEVNAKVMADPRMSGQMPDNMPFDCARMAYGGFRQIV